MATAASTGRIVAFDIDGVLLHAWRFREFLENRHGLPPAVTASFFHGEFRECLVGRGDLRAALLHHLPRWGWTTGADAFIETWFALDGTLNEPVGQAVCRLRQSGVRCVIASNQEPYRAQWLRRVFEPLDVFEAFYFSCDIGAAKPSRAFFEAVAKALGVAGDRLCLVDDLEENVEGARAAGWDALLFVTPDDLQCESFVER